MFVTKATFLRELLELYDFELYEGLTKIVGWWDNEKLRQVLAEVWPGLEKILIVAEPAAAEGRVAVVLATFGVSYSRLFLRIIVLMAPELV